METNKSKPEGVCKSSRRENIPKVPCTPQEATFNSMAITSNRHKVFWRPNNYRRQIEVKTKSNSTIKNIKSAIPNTNVNQHTKILSIKNFQENITIQYGKKILTGIYSQNIIHGEKEIFFIESDCIEGLQEWINNKKNQIEARIDKALRDFSERFKLTKASKVPVWSRYEDFIKGEDFIDQIPEEVIIHDTFFKKVYGKGIEFKNTGKGEDPGVHLKNYIKNRAVEDISPIIANALLTANPLRALRQIILKPLDILNYPELVRVLTDQEKKELEDHLFSL